MRVCEDAHVRVIPCMCERVRAFVGAHVCACGRTSVRAYVRAWEGSHVNVCA